MSKDFIGEKEEEEKEEGKEENAGEGEYEEEDEGKEEVKEEEKEVVFDKKGGGTDDVDDEREGSGSG